MQCDEQSPWHWIEQKKLEYKQQNETLRTLLSQIGDTLVKSAEAKQGIQNGAYMMGCQDWADCKKYTEDVDQWISQGMACMGHVNENIISIIVQLGQTLDQHIEKYAVTKTATWKTAQRWALMAKPLKEADSSQQTVPSGEETVPGFGELSQWYDETEKGIELLSKIIKEYSMSFFDLSKWGHLSSVTIQLQKDVINFCYRIKQGIHRIKQKLVQRSFLVFMQPPAVVRRSPNPTAEVTKTRKDSKIPFDLEIRALAGTSYGILHRNVLVEIFLISESQSQDIVNGELNPFQENLPTSGELTYTPVVLQATSAQDDGKMCATFQNVRVQSMNNHNSEDTGTVPLYHILFRSQPFRLNDGADCVLQFWTISLPFTILSNAHRQDKLARARMFWHLSFKIDDRTSLATVVHAGDDGNEIRWKDFFPYLDHWFRKTIEGFRKDSNGFKVHCQHGLDEHCEYIAGRLGVPVPVDPEALVTWDAFYKKKMVICTHPSFWLWFCLIADYLAKVPKYWDSGLICGFVSRHEAERLLREANLPAMVLRFSESNPGKMVVSYFLPDKNIMEHVLFDETENKALEGKTLAKCIQLSQNLSTIEYILPANKPVGDLFALDSSQIANEASKPKKKVGYIQPAIALLWEPPPIPPQCLMNISIAEDMVYERSPSFADSLDKVEFDIAGRSLEECLDLADEIEKGIWITD